MCIAPPTPTLTRGLLGRRAVGPLRLERLSLMCGHIEGTSPARADLRELVRCYIYAVWLGKSSRLKTLLRALAANMVEKNALENDWKPRKQKRLTKLAGIHH